MNLTTERIGWIQAFVAILIFLGINQVMGRYSAVVLEVNPILYSCIAFNSCAFVLLARAGYGNLAKETVRSVDTWIYGTILMMSYIIGMLLFALVTSTEGTMLQKISVLLGLLGSWFFLGRSPDIYQIIGTIVITAAVILVATGIQSDNLGAVYLLAFLYGLLQVGRIFAAELHRPHSKAASSDDPKSKARVVGFVMFIISVIFLMITFLIALAQEAQGDKILPGLPTFADFVHSPTIFAGMIAGVIIVAPSRILEFSSSHIIKAENFTTVTTLSFISTLFWEWLTSPVTGLSIKTISTSDIVAGVLITAGGLFIALTRKVAKKSASVVPVFLYEELHDLEAVDDTREMISNALAHFDGDSKKAAGALKIPEPVVAALLADREKVLAFKPAVLKKVARQYRRNIASADALTGLSNRASFMIALKNAPYEADVYSILFIDLNDFKPVNDTYGHDAGDAVLRGVAERLSAHYPTRSLVTRLGGDEFAVLRLDVAGDAAAAEVGEVKQLLAQPFSIAGAEITIGAAIGIASYPADGSDPEQLLKHADNQMYGQKQER